MKARAGRNLVVTVFAIGFALACAGCGGDPPHPAAAVEVYVADAIDHYDTHGLQDTIDTYSDHDSIEGDLYLALLDVDSGEILAHFSEYQIGTTSSSTETHDGRNVREAFLVAAREGHASWLSYGAVAPTTAEQIRSKHAWGVPHDGLLFVSGYYDPAG